VTRAGLFSLLVRGFAAALETWKALLLALALNALLAAAVARPVGSALHAVADESPTASRLLASEKATFYAHFNRAHRGAFGEVEVLEDLATGNDVKRSLLTLSGGAGTLVFLSLASALLAALLAGGFAGRFGAERDRGSLAAFGGDCGRFAFSSLLLGTLSLAGIVVAYRFVYAWPGTLYDANELRYEWEGVLLSLSRLGAFLLVAGFVRLLVLYARAQIGLSRNGNPFLALMTAAGFIAGRPLRTLALEVLFSGAGLLPLLAWGLYAPLWDGSDTLSLALFVAAQQLVVFWRITARAAHLGGASAFLRRSREAVAAAAPPSRAVEPLPVPAVP
jgi:hypothetical protein